MREAYYRVTAVYTKYSNKWFLDKGGVVRVTKKEDEGKVVLFVAMVDKNPIDGSYSDVLPSTSRAGHKTNVIFRRIDGYRTRMHILGKIR